MKTYSLEEIIYFAKENSPFYQDQFKELQDLNLKNIPIINQDKFWKSEILTTKKPTGIVFKSGGSSGAPKFSYFTHEEWISFTQVFGEGISKGILEDGDRVGNLFYVGDLYASFLFIKDSLQWIDNKKLSLSQYPIAGNLDFNNILKIIEEFDINVLCGVPSQILKLLEYFHQHRDEYKKIKIEKVLFGGEALYPDQYEAYHQIIPTLKISSIGIASVDGGLIGYTSKDCEVGEQRVFSEATVIEIVDVDTGEIITEKYKTGKILLTNLTRKLMPIIRYPAGDLAMWVEDETVKDRKFKLMGRSDEAARLGTISVYFEDTRKLVTETLSDVTGIQFQMKLEHFDHKDSLTLVIAGHNLKEESGVIEKILNAFIKDKKVYSEVLNKGLIHPLKIKIVKMEELESNVRTGKLKRVIDTRI